MRKWWDDEYPEPISVTLSRDSFSTPWGFRIAGGLDFGQTPIVVTQVNICSPADGQLAVGDVVISVDHQQVFRRRHFDVLSMLTKEAGGTLELQLYRGSTAEGIKARSGFNVRFHAPLNYFPVNCANLWHASSAADSYHQQSEQPDSHQHLDRPNAMYRSGPSQNRPTISVRRQNPYNQSTSMSSASPAGRIGTQRYFNPPQDEYMLQKVQQSLDALTMGRPSRLDGLVADPMANEPDFNYVPVTDKRRQFNQPQQQPGPYLHQHQHAIRPARNNNSFGLDYNQPRFRAHSVGPGQRSSAMRGPTPSSYSAFIRPRSSMGQPVSKAPEFCWMPRGFKPRRGMSQPTRGNSAASYSAYPQYQQQPEQNYEIISPQSIKVFTHEGEGDAHYIPPWKGTLHSASPSAWIEGQLIDPDNPIYRRPHGKRDNDAPAEPIQIIETKEAEDGRKVVHLQYNSPLALYSSDAAKKALEDQVQGGPEGTIIIKGGRPGAPPQKITQSETYRMVHEEDLRRQRRAQRGAGGPSSHQRQSSGSRQQHPSGDNAAPTASAAGQLKVVLSQPPQHQQQNYFGGNDAGNRHHGNNNAPSGFSDF